MGGGGCEKKDCRLAAKGAWMSANKIAEKEMARRFLQRGAQHCAPKELLGLPAQGAFFEGVDVSEGQNA